MWLSFGLLQKKKDGKNEKEYLSLGVLNAMKKNK